MPRSSHRTPRSSRRPRKRHAPCHLFSLLVLGLIVALSLPANAAQGTTVIRAQSTGTAAQTHSLASRVLAEGTAYATPYYDNDSGIAGPTVVVVGGMHGNEPAGYTAAAKFATLMPRRGRLIVIPEANTLAVKAGTRTGSHPGDLNRDFPTSKSGKTGSVLAESIWKLLREVDPDYLFDLHEGYDFHKLNKESVGQSIIYYPTGDAASMAKAMQSEVNRTITNKNHRFSLLKYPIKGSLARAAGMVLGTKAMIIETSRKQAFETRVEQHVTMVRAALRKLQML